jgi:preprotein translocase subunit SecG
MNILLTIHVIITVLMIGVILIQKSEGGALGIGGGGNNMFTARGTANFLTRLTAILACLFVCNCIVMTVVSSKNIKSQTSILADTNSSDTNQKKPL